MCCVCILRYVHVHVCIVAVWCVMFMYTNYLCCCSCYCYCVCSVCLSLCVSGWQQLCDDACECRGALVGISRLALAEEAQPKSICGRVFLYFI